MMESGLRVLVVDDERLVRWSICSHLSRAGYQAKSVESGEEALEALASAPCDLMLLDVRLPKMNGLAVLERALTLYPEVIVVMMSAHADVSAAVKAMKDGATDFLVKPFRFRALDSTITRAIELRTLRGKIAGASARGEDMGSLIVGESTALETIRNTVARVASIDDATVLIEGESGSGKEVVARSVHLGSGRAEKPFVQLNCGALSEQLFESELFGHESGAFTGAQTRKAGLVETAEGGTIFLDELGELSHGGQVKLLQLLENRTYRRVGGTEELRVDVRVVAATNACLEKNVSAGTFRADLYFRLNVVAIRVPPLREHLEDVPTLASHFLARFNSKMGCAVNGITSEALEMLMRYDWPGNVRELRNTIERALILNQGATELRPEHLPTRVREAVVKEHIVAEQSTPFSEGLTLDEVEKQLIRGALERWDGNQSKAARELGISRDTLRYRIKKHGDLE